MPARSDIPDLYPGQPITVTLHTGEYFHAHYHSRDARSLVVEDEGDIYTIGLRRVAEVRGDERQGDRDA